MSLRLPGRMDTLHPKTAVLDRPVDPKEDRHWNAKAPSKLLSTENRGQAVHAEEIT